MASSNDVLKRLIQQKEKNIQKLLNWSLADFDEMLETYAKAKEVAIEMNDPEAQGILTEKISQLKEALSLKKQNNDLNI